MSELKKMNTLTIGEDTWAVGCPQIRHESNEATIEPNVWNVWGEVGELAITKGDEIGGIVNNYMIRFTAGANTKITLNWDDTQVTWYGGEEPTWTDGKIYEISIVDNIALWSEF